MNPATRAGTAPLPPLARPRTRSLVVALAGSLALLAVALVGVAALVLPIAALLAGALVAVGRNPERASRSGERDYQTLAEHLPYTAVLGFDRELRVTFASGPALPAAGFSATDGPSEQPLPAALADHCRAALAGDSRFLEQRTESGRTQWVRIFPLTDDDGQIESGMAVLIDVSDRARARSALELEQAITARVGDGALVIRAADATIVHSSGSFERMFGLASGVVVGEPFARVFADTAQRTQAETAERVVEKLRRRGTWTGEVEAVRGDGTPFPCRIAISSLIHPDHGRVWIAVLADITGERDAIEARQEAEEDFRSAFEAAPIGMAVTGLDGRFGRVNRALCELTGYSREELEGRQYSEITHPEDRELSLELLRRLGGGQTERIEKRYVTASGDCIPVEESVTLVRDPQGRALHYLAQVQDVSARKAAEEQLKYLADHDHLTGLFNRRRFEEELERQVALAARYGGGGAVLELDLDDFKLVNDSLGHAAGDEVISVVAGALRDRLRTTDVLARLGGDEFGVLLPVADARQARHVGDGLVDAISRATEGTIHPLTASVGVALFDGTEDLTAEQLRVEADIAMYEAKEAGRGLVAVYDRAETEPRGRASRHAWEHRIREALAGDRFMLYAQPIVSLDGPEPGGAAARHELLLRMIGENGDPILPGAFLPEAEQHDLVQEIDRWVVGRSLEVLAAEQARGHDVCLDVNISAKSLSDPELAAFLRAELNRTGADSDGLVLEIPEGATLLRPEEARALSESLADLGCHFALDDFAPGFATFHQLDHLPFDYLKIDGRLVRDLPDNPTNQEVVRSLVELARSLDQRTIAEFVTGPRTVDVLRDLGVDYAQGFYVGRPRPVQGARLHETAVV